MIKPSAEEINKKMKSLPAALLDMLVDKKTGETITEICKKQNLSTAATTGVMVETNLVILGFTKPEEFITQIESHAIEPISAEAIAKEIESRIFTEVKEKLKKFYREEQEDAEEVEIVPENDTVAPKPPSILEVQQYVQSKTQTTKTDYSTPKQELQVAPKPHDPYREAVE